MAWLSILAVSLLLLIVVVLFKLLSKVPKKHERFVIGFFHPYCNAGGGGERVLWCAIQAVQEVMPDASCVVYTGDDVSTKDLIAKVKDTFGIEFRYPDNIELIYLKKRYWVEASRYKAFTMIGQSLGSLVLGWEALTLLNPHVFIDTMGYAFTLPIFRVFGRCSVACYVHYPTISSDMLSRVVEQRSTYNNDQRISGNKYLSFGKFAYYKSFSWVYCFMGKFSQIVMANSTWTANHIRDIWGRMPEIVYPPCDTRSLQKIPLNWEGRENIILSIAQFRPEKDHRLQIDSFAHLLNNHPELKGKTKLVMVGSCRNAEDQQRIDDLKGRCNKLGVQDSVLFEVGIKLPKLIEWLSCAAIGIHTMWCEHFGIGVVELMAAGVIPVAHNSGGPKADIVPKGTGFLATTAQEYSDNIYEILSNRPKYAVMQKAGREHANRFSEEVFIDRFKSCMRPLLKR